jgi:hypothetical protein
MATLNIFRSRLAALTVVMVLIFGVSACGGSEEPTATPPPAEPTATPEPPTATPEPAAPATNAAPIKVSFVNLTGSTTIDAPFPVQMAVENLTLEPAGEVKAGHGHLHVMVNQPCVEPGQVIIKDASHLHYGQGQSEAILDLLPGDYTLCLQAADGAHLALDATQVVSVTVGSYTAPKVVFLSPTHGMTVTSPFSVTMGVENLTLEPAGEPRAGSGHLHITVNGDCTPAGEVIIKDDTHLHYGQGQSEATLALPAGEHTLCLQAADGAHIALPGLYATQVITVAVQ